MLSLSPADKQKLFADAQAHRKARRFEAARDRFQTLALAEPKSPELQLHLSEAAFDAGDRAACLKHLTRATELAPRAAKLWAIAADRFAHLGENDRALHAFDRLIALEPTSVAHRANRARHLQLMGRFDAAETALRALIKAHGTDAELYRILASTTRLSETDPITLAMVKLWRHPRLNDRGRMNLGFALAKVMEDNGAQDRVFRYLDAANAAQQRLAPFDPDQLRQETDALLAAQDTHSLAPPAGASTPRSVFVCGTPRSGTTLVEQILGRHRDGTPGGELGHLYREAQFAFGTPPAMTPLDTLSDAALARWAERYRALVVRDTGATAGFVTDKSIRTERIFGLIRRGLPGARLIVVHRDPRDTALSIYKNHFALGTHRYANRLQDIATVIRQFRATVAHWKARMPDALHEIRYEDLVSAPEATARALVAAAGLDWDPACIDPAATKGNVSTLSLAQVREPIHTRRRAAWERYAEHMQPFIDAWGDTPWD